MPLTASGMKVMNSMMKEYGSEKGKEVFYASMKKKMKGSEKWHGAESKHGKNGYTDALKGGK